MATVDDLTAPQRAVLQLLLKRGKSYDEIATMLKLDRGVVQSRAHEAVAALGPATPDIGADRRNEVADYLLGQQAASGRAATREYLEDSGEGRSWARSVAGSLRPLAADGLPEIPSEPDEVDEAFSALDAREARKAEVQGKSQLGTKILFGAAGLAVAVVLILALGILDGDDDGQDPKTATITRTGATTPGETPQAIAQGVLAPPASSDSQASAETAIVRYPSSNQFKLLIVAKKLATPREGSAYGIWLYTSRSDALFVGFPKSAVTAAGDLSVVADLSPDTRNYREVLITRESVEKPTRPGAIALRGRLQVAAATTTGTQTVAPTTTTP
ncbi:MAG: hypothetical protein QOI73_2188 [Solirubrobacteraceae bacterium]|nr:hypothetical protein [Solirubrobacteraceae bacterium]